MDVNDKLASSLDEIRHSSQPYWETRLILSELESVMSDPARISFYTAQERQELARILSHSSRPSTRWKYYAQDIINNTDDRNGIQIPSNKQRELLGMIDIAVQAKYSRVAHLLGNGGIDDVQAKQRDLQQIRLRLPEKRRMLITLVNRYMNVVLELLRTVWLIIKERASENTKNEVLTTYYWALADTLLLRIKILRLTILIKMYDTDFVNALKSLSAIVRTRLHEAQTKLFFVEKRIREYDDLGAEMEAVAAAYSGILDDIAKTEEDINKIRDRT